MIRSIIVIFTIIFISSSCQQTIQNSPSVSIEVIISLTDQLIYGEKEELRVNALEALTIIGMSNRYTALTQLIEAADNNPDLFPVGEYSASNSLLDAIITLPSDSNAHLKKKDLIEKRMTHVKLLNQLLLITMRYRMYYEMAVILCQKYAYGTLWAQESLTIHRNKPAATEFTHARNGARANLRLLLSIISDEITTNLINDCLKNSDEQ